MDANRIKELKEIAARFMGFGSQKPTPAQAASKFEAFKIKGSEEMVEASPELEVGSDVMKSSGTGSIPATDGKYELDNGAIFTVKDGKIDAVENDGKQAEATDEDKTLTPEKMAEVLVAFNLLKVEFEAVKTELGTLKTEVATAKEAFAKVPTAEAIVQFNTDVQSIGKAITDLAAIPFETEATKKDPVNPDAQREQGFANVAAKFSEVATD